MSALYSEVRVVHIACGTIALFVAPAAMLAVKGGKAHRTWGKIYFGSMAAAAATSLFMSIYKPILFLGLVAVFSFYFAFRGYRELLTKHREAAALDWMASLLALIGSAGLIVLGLFPPRGQFLPATIVALVFGVAGVLIRGGDMWRFREPPAQGQMERNGWWFRHMGGMLGSYIATVTASSAVNFHFLPPAIRWLWPSLLGVPAIFVWIGYYRRKLGVGEQQRIGKVALSEFGSGVDCT